MFDALLLLQCKTFLELAPLWYTKNNGVPAKYNISDLKYDLSKRHLVLKTYTAARATLADPTPGYTKFMERAHLGESVFNIAYALSHTDSHNATGDEMHAMKAAVKKKCFDKLLLDKAVDALSRCPATDREADAIDSASNTTTWRNDAP